MHVSRITYYHSRSESLETSPVPPNHVEPLYSKVEPSSSRHRRHQSVCGVPVGGAQPQVPNHVHLLPQMESKDILSEDLAVSIITIYDSIANELLLPSSTQETFYN